MTAKRVDQTLAEWAQDKLDKLLDKMPAADGVILLSGFVAGQAGYTPLTWLINVFGADAGFNPVGAVSPLDQFLITVFGPFPGGDFSREELVGQRLRQIKNEEKNLTPKEKGELRIAKALDKITKGCVGMIEAYALTRPGTAAAALRLPGDILKGIGEIIPG